MESNGHTSATTVSNDPWLSSIAPTPQANPWSGNNQTMATNDTSLSVNISDPWGLGATNSRPTPIATSPPATTKTIDNELSDFFGASAGRFFRLFFTSILFFFFIAISSSYDQQHQQQHASSNPWNITSSSMNPGSISPPNTNLSMGYSGGNLLYPIITSGNNSNPTSTSPLSSSSLSASRKTPESFLGDKFSTLVNLDKLVTEPKSNF